VTFTGLYPERAAELWLPGLLLPFCRTMPPAKIAFLTALLVLSSAGCARRAGTDDGPSRAPSTAATTSAAPDARGKELYERYCALCHGKDATGYAADNAPSLVSKTFLESASNDFIAKGIRFGRPHTAMGAYGKQRGGPLEERDIEAIVLFLRARGPAYQPRPPASLPAGDPQKGRALYDRECASCHGTEQERRTALSLYNPELLLAATPDFLRYAIVHGRPPTPMPAFVPKLSPGEIEDIVAYLVSKAPPRASAPAASASVKVPEGGPVVINPKGSAPKFTLRDQRFVSSEQVKKALDEKRRLIIVDARSPADWVDMHIPGAISGPYYDDTTLARIPNDGTWVIAYCACPHHASGEVVDKLRGRGFKNTAVLDEGILFWKQKGYPLTEKKP
jgi:cytochrome c oxidase cbb3-type subunit III